jgi:hypothetical protein
MRTIERRVSALEEASFAGGGGECPECGDGEEPYEVVFDDELPDDLEENCPGCGRGLITTIYFEDDPNAPWNRVGARQEGAE